MENKRWDVLGLGAVAVDDLFYVDHFPQPDDKEPVREKRRAGGGLAGTALVAASRLGAGTAYCGVLGDDELSRYTIEELEREGVDCSPVQFNANARPFHAIIIVERSSGRRTILSSGEGVCGCPPETINDALIAACRVLFVDHTLLPSAIRAASIARNHGIPVVADIEAVDIPSLPELLKNIDHLIIGLRVARRLAGCDEVAEILNFILREYCPCCVVTDGANGSWYQERSNPAHHVPAFQVAVVDTTGCGDVFHGAYAASLAQGETVASSVLIASAAAGLKAAQPGGRQGIPDKGEITLFLQAQNVAGI